PRPRLAQGGGGGGGGGGGERRAGLGYDALLVETHVGAGAGDGDVHLAARGEAQIGDRRSSRRGWKDDRDEKLARLDRGLAGSDEKLLERQPSRSRRSGNVRLGSVADQCGNRVGGRRRVADIAPEARSVLHLP